jgi:hypothetical protein
MDDFLHNLRSGKLKQPDRGRRDYTDYKGPQRRAGNERRKPDFYAKVTGENFNMVKGSLDALADQQKRIAEAMATRNETEQRIADALEAIAAMMKRHWGHQNDFSTDHDPIEAEPNGETMERRVPAEVVDNLSGIDTGSKKLSNIDKPKLMAIVAAMRAEGKSWEKIARHMDERDIPTVSGKGKWRGPAIKKVWDAHAQSTGS